MVFTDEENEFQFTDIRVNARAEELMINLFDAMFPKMDMLDSSSPNRKKFRLLMANLRKYNLTVKELRNTMKEFSMTYKNPADWMPAHFIDLINSANPSRRF